MNALTAFVPNLVGGSADLNPSTNTALKGLGNFQPPPTPAEPTQGIVSGPWGYEGNNVAFGVREHAMGAIVNGMALHGGLLPFGSTFLIFSDYMRPALRLAAIMKLKTLYIFTHDTIGIGEDGPTHQPIEQLTGLRAIPNFTVIRPADANETVEAWKVALQHRGGPLAIILTRQTLPTLDRSKVAPASGVARGAYVLADASPLRPEVILIAAGSEVHPALEAYEKLRAEGISARVVNMVSWELFERQPEEYKRQVLPPEVRTRVSVEAGSTHGWGKYVGLEGETIGIDRFGASAPGKVLMEKFGFTAGYIVDRAKAVLAKKKTLES